ncbi:MAG: glycoside hydrolase family 1 protein, partial [Spirochaetia bacterium]|nr:glycoside hydrolase family 1 protein [Spirochaetia bacterium]
MNTDRFLWCCGIEDTFIADPHPRTGKTLDEYELTGHYQNWKADFAKVK